MWVWGNKALVLENMGLESEKKQRVEEWGSMVQELENIKQVLVYSVLVQENIVRVWET